jgi:mRNA interferase MazF
MITAEESYLLQAGDLVWVDLRPTRGREQSGVRPAVVLTDREYHRRNETAVICPITRNVAPWPTKVFLPSGLEAEGAVLTDQIRTVDRLRWGFRHIGNVPDEILSAVRVKIATLLAIDVTHIVGAHHRG